jgi:hypothetical protein
MFTKLDEYRVECYVCDYQFQARGTDIEIELEETWTEDDYWFIHIYTTYCPQCNKDQTIDILDPHHCCDL